MSNSLRDIRATEESRNRNANQEQPSLRVERRDSNRNGRDDLNRRDNGNEKK